MVTPTCGSRYGRLTYLGDAEPAGKGNAHARRRWRVQCDCGTEFVTNARCVLRGQSQSCGCLRRDRQVERLQTHGLSRTPEYRAWIDMKQRCYYAGFAQRQHYADRGIVVCDRWKNSFENFLSDVGTRPSPKHSLDRINNDGIYEPTNCRWATKFVQQTNRRVVRLHQYDGEMISASELSRRTNIPYRTLLRHLLARTDPLEIILSQLLSR